MRPLKMIGMAFTLAAAAVLATPGTSEAGDRHWRDGPGRGHHGRGWGPPQRHVYVAPPPRYYAPPPRVYYAPPPVYVVPGPRYYYPPPAYYAPPPGVSLNFRF